MALTPWAGLVVEPDGAVTVYVHNWIKAGSARSPEELWALAHEAWSTPEKYWNLFYQGLGRSELPRADPRLAGLTVDDLGL